ncbi:TPA: hypothetical protein DCX16_00360 [bacterium]|nr:hypothetical protein [bacterium]
MWKRLDVIFVLKSPLHIGYLPFKGFVISPTRYYIPGKNLWGVITKRATENLYPTRPSDKYREIGEQIKENFKFSYFYLYDGDTIFVPSYTEEGLIFGDKEQIINKFEFEHRFIGSRVLTAIDCYLGTAKDESLHEIEFIKDKFKDKEGQVKDTRLIGCIWVKNGTNLNGNEIECNEKKGIFVGSFNLIEELIIGGEQNYGFGLMKLERIINGRFPIKDSPEGGEIKIVIKENEPILSHFKYTKDISFCGDIEIIAGRGYFDIEEAGGKSATEYKKGAGKIISNKGYFLSPGTLLKSERKVSLDWNGILSEE